MAHFGQRHLLLLMATLCRIANVQEKSGDATSSPSLSVILKLSHKDIHYLWTTNMSTESLFYPLFPLNQPGSQPDPLCHIDHFDGNQSIKITIDLIDGEDDGMQSH